MSYNQLTTEVSENIITITIDRAAKMNALNRETIAELGRAFEEAGNDASIRGIILTGAGEKAFAAGADIAEFAGYSVAEAREMAENGHRVFNMIERTTKPVVAAINGFALGGGCELAMACHLRVAAEHAQFGQPEPGLGILPGYGGTQRLLQLVGRGKALELLMTGDMVNAPTAKTLGLVNAVAAPEKLMDKCREILKKIMSKAPLAISAIIECTNAAADMQQNGFQLEVEHFSKIFATEDFKTGTQAFLNKEKPDFQGK